MILPTLTRDGVWKWRWQFATQRLRDAYDASRSALDDTLRKIESEDAKRLKQRPDGTDQDELDAYDAWIDHIVDRYDEAQNALEMIKHGFAVILYHSWEKNAIDWSGWKKKYHHALVTKKLKDKGYIIHPGVHKLRKVANTIKHDSNELWLEDKTMFEETLGHMSTEGILSGYARFIKISDDQMSGFFDALLESGFSGKSTPSL